MRIKDQRTGLSVVETHLVGTAQVAYQVINRLD